MINLQFGLFFAAVEASPHDLCWANFLLPSQGSELNESPPAECGKDFRLLQGSLEGRRWIINDDIMLRNEIYDALFKSICFCGKSLFSIQVVFLLSSLISPGPPNPPRSLRVVEVKIIIFRRRILKCHNLDAQWDRRLYPLQGSASALKPEGSTGNWLWKIINKLSTVNLTNDCHTQL